MSVELGNRTSTPLFGRYLFIYFVLIFLFLLSSIYQLLRRDKGQYFFVDILIRHLGQVMI